MGNVSDASTLCVFFVDVLFFVLFPTFYAPALCSSYRGYNYKLGVIGA